MNTGLLSSVSDDALGPGLLDEPQTQSMARVKLFSSGLKETIRGFAVS